MLFLLPILLSCTALPPARPIAAGQRWISLAPSTTEILFAIGAGPQVVGVCAPANAPPQAASLPVVASWERLDVERVLALTPRECFTVVGMQPGVPLETLGRMGVAVTAYPMRTVSDLWACMSDMGHRTGHGEEAGQCVARLKARIAEATRDVGGPPVKAAAVVGVDPLTVAAGGGYLSGVLVICGYEDVFAKRAEAYPALSLETLAGALPEALVFPEGEISPSACQDLVNQLQAVIRRPVRRIMVPADLLVRPGPRVAEAVDILIQARRSVVARRAP